MEVESHEEASEQARATFESERAKKEALEQTRSRRWRFRVVSMVLPALLGSLAFLGVNLIDPEYLYFEFGLSREIIALAIIGLFGWSGFNTVMLYLQTGFKYESPTELAPTPYEAKIQEAEVDLSRSLSEFSSRLADLEARTERGDFSTHDISDSERTDLITHLRESIEKAAKTDFLDEIRASVKESQASSELASELQERHRSTTRRLNKELLDLTRRGNVNLSIGSATAVIGMVLLGLFVLELDMASSDGGALTFTMSFIPRLSLVVFVEIFAYFFLRLYSASLMEIKYFQNEITNVEAKFLALRTAMYLGEKKIVETVISQLSRTERNYILQKGQTTADLERSRVEKEAITSLTQSWLKALPRRLYS